MFEIFAIMSDQRVSFDILHPVEKELMVRKKVQANVDTSKSGKYVIGIDLFDELGSMMMPEEAYAN